MVVGQRRQSLELSSQTLPGLPKVELSNTEFGPSRWVIDGIANLTRGDVSGTVAAHYSSGHDVLYPLSAQPVIYNDFTPNPNPLYTSDGMTTFDVQLAYQPRTNDGWNRGLRLQVGARNLFNTKPALVDNQVGFLSNRYDVRGRVIYVDVSKSF